MEVINLNFIPSGANPVAHASQFDEGRTTRFNLFDGSAVYTLDGTEIITVSVRKPDGHIVTESVTNTSSTYVEVVTTEQMTACAGDNLAQIKVEKGGDTIGFLNYILSVQKDPEDGGDPSASFIHDLEQQIADAVADQYDSNAVIFDAAPVPGHGVGYAVTSEGVKNAIDGAIAGLTIPEELDDLTDVVITGPTDGDILVYQNGEWVNMANPASTANFAADYDATATYNTGDKCIYNNLLYICNTDNTTGTWDPSAWDFTPVGDWDASNIPLGSDFSDPNSTATAIGDLSQLTTSVTSSLVGAVNEVDAEISSLATVATSGLFNDLLSNPFNNNGLIGDLNIAVRGAGECKINVYNGGATNSPSGSAGGWVFTFTNNGSTAYGGQFAISNGGMYYRALVSNNYGTWRTIATA